MASTAVVNKRGRKRGKAKGRKKPSRRRNYGAASANAPKRRRRRNPGPAPRRRSNTHRRSNPSLFNWDALMDTLPAATTGVWMGRWAVKQAGEFEPAADGTPEPGFKHAIAIYLAASVGSDMVGNMLGSSAKGEYARIACLGFGGDLFMRKRFMRDSEWVNKNLSLEGLGEDDDYETEYVDEDGNPVDEDGNLLGFEAESPLGQTDAMGNQHVKMQDGSWKLAGNLGAGERFVGPDGTLYELSGGMGAATYPANYRDVMSGVNGFESSSPLGMVPAQSNSSNSFGYSS